MTCKMCDRALKSSEIIWYPEEQRHEDLCVRCRAKIATDMREAGWEDSHITIDDLEVEADA